MREVEFEKRYSIPYNVPLFGTDALRKNSGLASVYTNPSAIVPEKEEEIDTVVKGGLEAEANGKLDQLIRMRRNTKETELIFSFIESPI